MDHEEMRGHILMWRRECAPEFGEEIRFGAGYEDHVRDIDAKRAWLRGLSSCQFCHGSGVRLEPIDRPILVLREDGYVKVKRLIGSCLYEGWEKWTPAMDEPLTRNVMCHH